jgi:radical SAM superfamily enzyme with C-terminal helix-hairpin-helix motif
VSQGASAPRCALTGRGVRHVFIGEVNHLFVVRAQPQDACGPGPGPARLEGLGEGCSREWAPACNHELVHRPGLG